MRYLENEHSAANVLANVKGSCNRGLESRLMSGTDRLFEVEREIVKQLANELIALTQAGKQIFRLW